MPAESSAAPGWTANARSLEFEETCNLRFTSNSRGGTPFFPTIAGRTFTTLEVPSTLPTLDETLAWDALRAGGDGAQLAFYRDAVHGTEVHTLHTEVEGRSKADLFARILDAWKADGVRFITLRELADEALARRGDVPVRELVRTTLPGRGGTVETGWPRSNDSP